MTKTATKEWFAVDRTGLRQILERRGRACAVLELVSNAWDQNVSLVEVLLEPIPNRRAMYSLRVIDDDPEGFKDLSHAFTLFAPSNKKGESEKRGRFNLGEKLVLALCEEAWIESTTGTIHFSEAGRERTTIKRERGSEFRAHVKLTKPEVAEVEALLQQTIVPLDVVTTFNGEALKHRTPLREFTGTLPTEIEDEEGNLRPTSRKTTIRVYEPLGSETPQIYEMGIPVVESGDRWHVDIGQKVPLNMDRDNVKPAYLRTLRTLVLNEMYQEIDEEDANSTWAKEAIEDTRVAPEALKAVIEQRFGEKVVSYDMHDREANNVAVSQGYTVVHGRQLSSEAWANVKAAELIKPAGQVTPSNSSITMKVLEENEKDGTKQVPDDKITADQRIVMEYAADIGRDLLGFRPTVKLHCDATMNALAWYGPAHGLTLNLGRLGKRWFSEPDQHAIDALLLHEFAHHRASNHLDHSFHDEVCRLGALLRDSQTWGFGPRVKEMAHA